MDFGLSEEQKLLQETVRGFVENECPPQHLRKIFDAGEGSDPALWSGLAEMGIAGLVVPEAYGGAGMEMLDLALVAEVLGAGAVPGPFLSHSLACVALSQCGTEATKHAWLRSMAEGVTVGSVALCEGDTGWSPGSWHTRVEGDRLSGRKRFVPHAALADVLIVGVEDGGLALVEVGAEHVSLRDMDGVDRTRPVFEVEFDAAPCTRLCDASGFERVRDAAFVLLAADSFGAASKLIDLSVAYAKTRKQFGTVIGQFQGVKHQLARLGTDIEPTRALFWYAAYAFDHLPEESERAVALAKAHITDRAMHTARQSVELHGGLGFTWECDVQIWFKRVMFDRGFFGTPDALRDQCAARAGW